MGGDDVHALAGVSMDFVDGEFVSILGPSGSGKSTMMNLLGCLDRPTSGSYELRGTDVASLDDDRLSDLRLRHLGFIFQNFNLIPQLTVLGNIQLPLFYQGWEEERSAARAEELAEKVGLKDRMNHRPVELSGGQQQRVAIARSLANDPAVIFGDEPTGNLDTATTNQIMDLLTELNQQGKTIILVTHEPEIAEYTRKQVYMRDGKVDKVLTN